LTIEYLQILAVIAILSLVQSFFGVGILVFGTPTLLLMGYDFITALGYLLPASFAISLLQVLSAGTSRVPISKYLYLLCLPGIGAGLWLVDMRPLAPWTNTLVGGTLLLSALVRLWPPCQGFFAIMLKKYLPAYHLFMGVIHGATNLGGAFLAILVSGINADKEATRYTVAHYYLTFSAIQMLLIATVMGHHKVLIASPLTAVVSISVYLLIGNRIFIHAGNQFYNTAITSFMAIYGFVILFKL
jgi:uncharacterized membrane protein YfcA